MVFGRKKKDMDPAEVQRLAIEKAEKMISEHKAKLAEIEERNKPTPTITVQEPPKMAGNAPIVTPPPVKVPELEPPRAPAPASAPAASGLEDLIKAVMDVYAPAFAPGVLPSDAQVIGLALQLAILHELRQLRTLAQDT